MCVPLLLFTSIVSVTFIVTSTLTVILIATFTCIVDCSWIVVEQYARIGQ